MSGSKRVTGADAIRRRLSAYWQMEAANVLLVPAFALWIAPPRSAVELAAMLVALAPACILLIAGALYWRAIVRRTEGTDAPMLSLMRALDRIERPALILIAMSWVINVAVIAIQGWSVPLWAALACSLLATLEYVNYFKVQLQHFDHASDWRRLRSGRGFRRAHLGRDLDSFRRSRPR